MIIYSPSNVSVFCSYSESQFFGTPQNFIVWTKTVETFFKIPTFMFIGGTQWRWVKGWKLAFGWTIPLNTKWTYFLLLWFYLTVIICPHRCIFCGFNVCPPAWFYRSRLEVLKMCSVLFSLVWCLDILHILPQISVGSADPDQSQRLTVFHCSDLLH